MLFQTLFLKTNLRDKVITLVLTNWQATCWCSKSPGGGGEGEWGSEHITWLTNSALWLASYPPLPHWHLIGRQFSTFPTFSYSNESQNAFRVIISYILLSARNKNELVWRVQFTFRGTSSREAWIAVTKKAEREVRRRFYRQHCLGKECLTLFLHAYFRELASVHHRTTKP